MPSPACHNDPPGATPHRQKMRRQMLRYASPFQLLFPLLGADGRVHELPVRLLREFSGDPTHVLRPRTGEFVDPAQVRHRVGGNGGLPPMGRYNSDSIGGETVQIFAAFLSATAFMQ
jgi:hypothetical protein